MQENAYLGWNVNDFILVQNLGVKCSNSKFLNQIMVQSKNMRKLYPHLNLRKAINYLHVDILML